MSYYFQPNMYYAALPPGTFIQPQPQPPQQIQYFNVPMHMAPPPMATMATAPAGGAIPLGPPPLPPPIVETVAPCCHNNWDNLRAKNSVVTLCCRDCQQKWKLQFPIRAMCVEFHQRMSCAFGVSCPYLHVHRFKSIAKSPNPTGHVVGSVKDPMWEACATEIMNKYPPPPQTLPSMVIDEVQELYRQRKAAMPQARVGSGGPEGAPPVMSGPLLQLGRPDSSMGSINSTAISSNNVNSSPTMSKPLAAGTTSPPSNSGSSPSLSLQGLPAPPPPPPPPQSAMVNWVMVPQQQGPPQHLPQAAGPQQFLIIPANSTQQFFFTPTTWGQM